MSPTKATSHEKKLAKVLVRWLREDLKEHWNAPGHISENICLEVSGNFYRDMMKLAYIHQSRTPLSQMNTGQIDPIKVAAYFAFWVRKLKPISYCFRKEHLDENSFPNKNDILKELTNINERISFKVGYRIIRNAAQNGDLTRIYPELSYEVTTNRLIAYDNTIQQDRSESADVSGKSIVNRLMYDMRFRTFGPHHYTMMFTQALFPGVAT